MTQTEEEKIIEKVRKLLALTEEGSNATQAEAENAAAKVQEILQRYNLERSQIEGAKERKHRMIMEKITLPTTRLWAKNLLDTLARFNFCKAIWYVGTKNAMLLGEETNIRVVMALYEHLASALQKMALNAYAQHRKERPYTYVASSTFRTNFYLGAVNMIMYRLHLQQEEFVKSAATSKALVVQNAEQLKAFTQEKFPKVTSQDLSEKRSAVSNHGYNEGLIAGSEVEIQKLVKKGEGE